MGRPNDNVRGRLTWGAMLVAATLGFGALSGCAKIEARDLIREGNKLYGDARFPEAIEKYNAAETLEPDGVTLFWNRACAAESQVLIMKDPEQREKRREYADIALKDFTKWRERLETKSAEEREQADEQLLHHRLALLNADERCDDLLEYWLGRQRDEPKEEALYKVIARQYSECGDASKEDLWYVKRTEDFPESVKAWHELAIRRFGPLFPEADSGLPYNEQIPPAKRIELADEVIRLLDKTTALDSRFRDAFVWRTMAFRQRQYSRMEIPDPELPEEKLEAIEARKDAMSAWRNEKAVCDIDDLPNCPPPPKVPEGPCCPPPPLTPQEEADGVELERTLNEEIKAIAEAALLAQQEEDAKAAKKKNRRKKKGK
ncbi:MAG: hypothetical protein JKY37_26140 [Nannocystaceae bacterium]|nr:hypothetical protein [Nannocystaceae bacterium]